MDIDSRPIRLLEQTQCNPFLPARHGPKAKLDVLSQEQHYQLVDWLLESISYKEIEKRLEERWGVKANKQNISIFYHRYVVTPLAEKVIKDRDKNIEIVRRLAKEIKNKPIQYDQCAIDALMGWITYMAQTKDGSTREIKILVEAVARIRTLARDEAELNRKLRLTALLERKEERATKTLNDTTLTAEEKANTLRQIFEK